MGAYNKYDPRLESLVMEERTFWDPEVGELTEDDKKWLSRMLHDQPQNAAKIEYERSHTGFARQITVTVADVERLYDQRVSS